ncbi:DegT/DnrJ/EryC1/StrS family aminotransferase, partial [Patescibacteria group bacterium]|nr:DegT/DnrJ/EryC1/StrS family aminotransferase [Patescibacteria group bacterium]
MSSKREEELKKDIYKSVKEIFELKKIKEEEFIPGKTFIQYAGSVFDDKEVNNVIDSWLEGWFGLGKKAQNFEDRLAKYLKVKGSILTNSGSSSNLLALA